MSGLTQIKEPIEPRARMLLAAATDEPERMIRSG